MNNKREIKKYISRIGVDVAQAVLPVAILAKTITEKAAEDALTKISQLQTEANARLNIAFDKAPESFENMRKYHAARSAYYRQAYSKAIDDFEKGIAKIIDPINKALSKK